MNLLAACVSLAALAHGPDLAGQRAELERSLHAQLDGKGPKAVAAWMGTEDGELSCLRWMLLERTGAVPAEDEAVTHWLLSDRTALAAFLGSGDVQDRRWAEALAVLGRIVAADPGAHEGTCLRLAVATALTFSTPVKAMADGTPIDPVRRYESFRDWDRQGVLSPCFRDLCTWELRYVVGSWATDEDLAWARGIIKPELRARDRIGDAAHMLAYRDTNARGVSVQEGRKFYDDRPMTLPVMLEYGGVCGAISRFGASMSQAHGIPAMPVGQPGHCAFIWQREPHAWALNNDVSGWSESRRHDGIQMTWGDQAWLVPLMQAAQRTPEAYLDAELLRAWARVVAPTAREAMAAAACEACPEDFAAWTDRAEAIAKPRASAWRDLLDDAARGLKAHPLAWEAIAQRSERAMLGDRPTEQARQDLATATARTLAGMAEAAAPGEVAAAWSHAVARLAAQGVAKEARPAVRAMLWGEGAAGTAIARPEAERTVRMAFASLGPLEGGGAWRPAIERAVRGCVAQPASRDAAARALEAKVQDLAGRRRADDARWLAGRVEEAAKQAKDDTLARRAARWRASIQ